jgi:centromere protein I
LKVWNGIDFEKEIFELVTYIKPGDYDDLYQDILLPLYRKYYVSDVFWKAKLIMCYTEWLKNWALLDWKGHTRRSMKQQEEEEERTEDEDVDRV